MKRKMVLILLTFIFVLAAVLVGCTKDKSSEAGTASDTASRPQDTGKSGGDAAESKGSADSNVNPPGVFPIVKNKITLKVFMEGSALVEDFATNSYTKWLEDKTNIHIDWTVSDEKNGDQQLNLALASGDLPDVIMAMGISPAQQMVYAEQGVFVPFNDVIDKYGDNIKKIFNEMPEAKDVVTAPEGKIYSLPYVNECYHCSMDYKMYVYQPWLKKLGLEEPKTTDEFYQMLKEFKENDPNGNGKADEIPLVASVSAGANRSAIDVFLMNAFIYDDGYKRMIMNDGKIDVTYNKPEWKEGLQYLHKLYAEGLIAPQSFTQDAASLKKIAENPDIAIAGAIPAHSPSSITIIEGSSNRWLDYQPIAPLVGPNGFQKAVWLPFDKIRLGNFVMTSANKYPEATMRWADVQYDFESALHANFGDEGKSWAWAKPGDLGRDGQPAKYELLVPFGRVNNEFWDQRGLDYRTDQDWYRGQAVTVQPNKEKMYYDVTKQNYEPYKQTIDKIVPPLYFPEDDSAKLADLDKTINDYFINMTARFISGDADIDKEWDKYISTLDKMNLQQYIEIYQRSYDASHAK